MNCYFCYCRVHNYGIPHCLSNLIASDDDDNDADILVYFFLKQVHTV